ncbi:PepSY-like domain-containing protein [Prevotella sp. 10(H)]|uniref:PepSY-like domain-containing protein n=1 Tax=Prevotella sp. 10(H) TaxID=1158294 RepID=UPI000ABCD0AE|nr:PepSY-like domain-containing protein [Prevotella sp. 10(H)]
MKKVFFVLSLFVASFVFVGCSDDDDVIVSFDDLPSPTQLFIKSHFPGEEVRLIEKDNDGYDVYLVNGYDIDFDKAGDWDDIDGHGKELPQSIINLIPKAISDYVTQNYPDQFITEINKERFGYEIELGNKVELEFDTEGNFLRVDSEDKDDVSTSFNDLPSAAQSFIKTHFPNEEVRLVEKDNDSYDVYLVNGYEIDFTISGDWDDVDGHGKKLPQGIIDLMPKAISDYVAQHYPDQFITEINKERLGYEIELNKRLELEFDSEGKFLRIDK